MMTLYMHPSPSKHRAKPWHLKILTNRRLISQFVCRLPLLALWSFLVIILLYKILITSEHQDLSNQSTLNYEQSSLEIKYEFSATGSNLKLPLSIPEKRKEVTINGRESDKELIENVITAVPSTLVLDQTKKSSSSQYSRRGKVLILIIQNENLYVLHAPPNEPPSSHQTKTTTNQILIPAHISILMNILDSHRIDYEIDTTRSGIPTSLLSDQNKHYSIIVIDDFIKYTRLNRWTRDQLDRHCRSNQIGVVTYFTSNEIDHLDQSNVINNKWNRSRRSIKAILLNQTQPSQEPSLSPLPVGQMQTEESLIDQFPISFKFLDHNVNNCRKNVGTCLLDYQVNEMSPLLRILKRRPDIIIDGLLGNNVNQYPWVTMSSNHFSYEPLTWAKMISSSNRRKRDFETASQPGSDSSEMDNSVYERQVLSMYDRGLFDGIKRVIFGGANQNWIDRILLLDSIEHLSSGKIFTPIERYIQIDIDDIFVGEKGTRLKPDDVHDLIKTQESFANKIEGGFKFNLGFSGKFFKRGFPEEIEGDDELIARAREFTWFCHTWAHTKAHLINDSEVIANELSKNLKFAREKKIPIIGYPEDMEDTRAFVVNRPTTYAVAPHHSGDSEAIRNLYMETRAALLTIPLNHSMAIVYPIHEQLYEAWEKMLNVQVTSTEEYPGLKPANKRRAFVHKTIKVLPRQTCGLYTHTIYKAKYPGGMEKLQASIRGGELFETVLHNPVNIYMTHMSNYANDRLAPYTFKALFEFVSKNTNLILKYAPTSVDRNGKLSLGPAKLADHYFRFYPSELNPLWTNPCNDKRHLAIWAQEKHKFCSNVPKLLIVGPQKTGTFALYTYLKMNPLFQSSQMSPTDFEEIQFFNDKHYEKGVDWYYSRFLSSNTNEAQSYNGGKDDDNNIMYFDKSATYFDDPKAPQRAFNLLPEARIAILLIDPADRAYSWYQHVKAHGDPIANAMSFEQIIMSKDDPLPDNSNSTRLAARNLRNRCLHPGYYAQHLLSWLDYYPSRQVIVIDGEWFKRDPASIMKKLQLILRIDHPLDYDNLLVFDDRKGFFCQKVSNGVNNCLGKSKGRKYPPMNKETRLFLNIHYSTHNRQLARLLSEIGLPLPLWLDKIMSIAHKV